MLEKECQMFWPIRACKFSWHGRRIQSVYQSSRLQKGNLKNLPCLSPWKTTFKCMNLSNDPGFNIESFTIFSKLLKWTVFVVEMTWKLPWFGSTTPGGRYLPSSLHVPVLGACRVDKNASLCYSALIFNHLSDNVFMNALQTAESWIIVAVAGDQ